ncbi:MAG: hypothetical protein HQM14_01825 [SAR324 cluster bacterium]|nr:hypothetical protein [SAR324 cluster bacterium]
MCSSNSDPSNAIFNFLQYNLESCAEARSDFELFLNQHENFSPAEALETFSNSLNSFKNCLGNLSNNPLDARVQSRIHRFVKKGHVWFKNTSLELLLPASESIPIPLLHHYVVYCDLLIQLKKLLNFLVIHCMRTQPTDLNWYALQQIHPVSARWFSFYTLWNKRRVLTASLGMLCLIFIYVFQYLWIPRAIDGFLVTYPNREFPDPHPADPFISTRATAAFQIIEANTFQKIMLSLPHALNLDRLSIILDPRPGSLIQVEEINFVGIQRQLLYTFHVNPLQDFWDYHNLQVMEGYHIHQQGLDILKALKTNRNLQQKLNEILGYEQSFEFDTSLVNDLENFKGKTFASKEKFNDALKTIDPIPGWQQRGIIRKIFEVPTYRKLGFSDRMVLVSPPVHVNQVKQIHIHLRLSRPFAPGNN